MMSSIDQIYFFLLKDPVSPGIDAFNPSCCTASALLLILVAQGGSVSRIHLLVCLEDRAPLFDNCSYVRFNFFSE